MKMLVVENVPDHLHERLRRQAERNHRSMTMEAMSVLEQGLSRQPTARPLPPPVKLRSGRTLTIEDIASVIAEGRE